MKPTPPKQKCKEKPTNALRKHGLRVPQKPP